jgi:hypothetical protein
VLELVLVILVILEPFLSRSGDLDLG